MTNSKQNAQHHSEVRVVEASAGSGKTYALAKRYVQLLLNPNLKYDSLPIKNILALTFTNKAAFEMKERILEFLKAIAFDNLSEEIRKDIIDPLGIDKEDAAKRATFFMDNIIRNYNFFQVQTIDKFIRALLIGCAFDLGLTSQFKIKTNTSEYIEHGLDLIIDKAAYEQGVYDSLKKFLDNYLYLENRTGWFPKKDMLSLLKELSNKSSYYEENFTTRGIASEDIIKKKKMILGDAKTLFDNMPEGTNKRFKDSLERFLSQKNSVFDTDSIPKGFAKEEYPANKGVEVSSDIDSLWCKIREEIKKLCVLESFSLFDTYIDLFQKINSTLENLLIKDDAILLSELNKKARSLLSEGGITAEDIYCRLATRLKHYLIDEFQDTSLLQWNNLQMMVEEALSSGGSLFYVGDKKQAIYGFRGGEVELFDEIKNNFKIYGPKNDSLSINWRSEKAIVEFNNAIFSEDNLKRFFDSKEAVDSEKSSDVFKKVFINEKDRRRFHNIFSGAKQQHTPDHGKGYVETIRVPEDKKDKSDLFIRENILNIISELKKRFELKDIALLVKTNAQVELLTNWLLEEGIAVESERTSNIKENKHIQELISFLNFLSSPIDNVSFAMFIQGDIFQKASSLSSNDIQNFIFNLRTKIRGEKGFSLYRAFRDQYPEVWDKYIKEFFSGVGLYPLYEMMISIYSQYECLRKFPDEQAFFMHFLELIKIKEEDGTDVDAFLKSFEELIGDELYVKLSESNAVKILTVHKSKGLEFPVTIIPYFTLDVQVGSRGEENTPKYVLRRAKDGGEIRLLRLKETYYRFSETLKDIYDDEYKESLISELDKSYVVLTRAKREMYVFIPKKAGASKNIAQLLIPDDIGKLGKKEKYKDEKEEDEKAVILPSSEYRDWIEFMQNEFSDESNVKNREKKAEGIIVHEILSFIKDEKDAARAEELFEISEKNNPHVDNFPEVRKKVMSILEKEEFRKILFSSGGEVFTEKGLVDKFGRTKRVDRLIVTESDVKVVDFKATDAFLDKDREQVEEYIQLLKDIYKEKRITGTIFYIDKMKLIEIDRNK